VFEMHTNTAVISARGTEWIAEAQPAATAIVALEGEVAVRNVDPDVPGAVALGSGEGVTVEAGTTPPAPTVWGDARRTSFIERTTVP
jgi:ferric-dicitrate binding protein FerR (iron transport regulator)